MDISFLIVTRNRPADLRITLNTLKHFIDLEKHEVLVYIDGCEQTKPLIEVYDWVQWSYSEKSVSASPARNALYKKAKGSIFIGLDDDAHPISSNFITQVESRFRESATLGILAFQEVRGLFASDQEALSYSIDGESYQTNDFVGCGFAIRKDAYEATNGFPVWMDIYGEETAVALEVMDAGFTINYDPHLKVNHRVDVEKRKSMGRNYFRFEHQLNNVLRFYTVYYPKPMSKIARALFHNFRKYALSDWTYFKSFWKVVFYFVIKLRTILKYRKPVQIASIEMKGALRDLTY